MRKKLDVIMQGLRVPLTLAAVVYLVIGIDVTLKSGDWLTATAVIVSVGFILWDTWRLK